MWRRVPKCPVRAEEQVWIEESLDWMVGEFGRAILLRPVSLPTVSFLPAGYAGSVDDVRAVFAGICELMEVAPDQVELELGEEDQQPLIDHVPLAFRSQEAAGHWRRHDGRTVVHVELRQDPVALVATIAHELGHQRLLGEDRISTSRRDHEPLTDLLTVFFGLGIFSANAAFEFRSSERSWGTSRLGYLTESMYGYALARYCWLRGESEPAWAEHLDVNPRTYLKQGLRFLNVSGDAH